MREEYVRNLVTVYPALIVAIIYVARPKFQVVRGLTIAPAMREGERPGGRERWDVNYRG